MHPHLALRNLIFFLFSFSSLLSHYGPFASTSTPTNIKTTQAKERTGKEKKKDYPPSTTYRPNATPSRPKRPVATAVTEVAKIPMAAHSTPNGRRRMAEASRRGLKRQLIPTLKLGEEEAVDGCGGRSNVMRLGPFSRSASLVVLCSRKTAGRGFQQNSSMIGSLNHPAGFSYDTRMKERLTKQGKNTYHHITLLSSSQYRVSYTELGSRSKA